MTPDTKVTVVKFMSAPDVPTSPSTTAAPPEANTRNQDAVPELPATALVTAFMVAVPALADPAAVEDSDIVTRAV